VDNVETDADDIPTEVRDLVEKVERDAARTLFRATRLAQVVKVLGDHADLGELTERAAVEVAELFSSDIALLLLGDDEALAVEASWGVRPGHLPSGRTAVPSVARQPNASVVVGSAEAVGYPHWLAPYSPRHVAWARLVARGEPLGHVMLARRGRTEFAAGDADELQAIATRIALAIDNGLLYRRMQAQLERVNRLYGLTTDLAGALNLELDGVAGLVSSTIHKEVDVGGVAVYLPDGNQLRLTGAAGDVDGLPHRVHPADLADGGLPGELLSLRAGNFGSGVVVVYDAPDRATEERALLLHIVELAALVIDKALLYDRTRRQAQFDPLTGLPNRSLLMNRLDRALARAQRGGQELAVIFLDVDRFKVINDGLGHSAGDELLAEVARRLTATMRAGDTVARLGGDEFVIICEGIDTPEEAAAVARRAQAAVAESPIEIRDGRVSVTVSQGIALTGLSGFSAEALLRDADTAMYRAKERGRGRFEVFDDEFRTRAVARLDVECALRDALDGGRLRVLYQPLLALPDRRVVGAEALMRYQDSSGRLVPPGEFMEVAEDSGLIVPMGEWILREAASQTVRWREQMPGHPPLSVSVNLSGRQIAQDGLPDIVAAVLSDTGADPRSLYLEITETVLMETGSRTLAALEAIKAMGVRLGIDDFGTGHSSLSYLRRFPVDFLKIDRSFVDGLGTDHEDSAIMAAIIGLARALGLRTVAEGVETDSQLARLNALGCDYGQGYRLGLPLAADALVEELGRCAAARPFA
jgi:diguanylate cyclase (GGDEF)-like protein